MAAIFAENIFSVDNMSALVQVMASHQTGGKPLSESMMIEFTDAIWCR